jgi:hypothetical protein
MVGGRLLPDGYETTGLQLVEAWGFRKCVSLLLYTA